VCYHCCGLKKIKKKERKKERKKRKNSRVSQVNAGGTCALYHTIGKMAGVGPHSLLLDVCCGTGTIGLTLAKQAGAFCGCEMCDV
jgi:tRNA/tmRNA/rRNA uracil-C5-methylase (TrmA/RlmC/RlmD family)